VTDPTTSASPRTKILTAAFALAAVAALALASFSGRWMTVTVEGSTGEFGLRSMDASYGDEHQAESLSSYVSDVKDGGGTASSAFWIAGWICSIALWVAAAMLAVAALLMLAGRFVVRPVAPTTLALVALAIGLISGVVFVAEKPAREMGPGVACYLFAFGELAGIIATILVARIRPSDPDWDNPQPFDEDKW
jgi:hypothetical protein